MKFIGSSRNNNKHSFTNTTNNRIKTYIFFMNKVEKTKTAS